MTFFMSNKITSCLHVLIYFVTKSLWNPILTTVDTQNVVEPLEDWSNCVFAALDGIYSTKRATDMRPFKVRYPKLPTYY